MTKCRQGRGVWWVGLSGRFNKVRLLDMDSLVTRIYNVCVRVLPIHVLWAIDVYITYTAAARTINLSTIRRQNVFFVSTLCYIVTNNGIFE